MMNRMENAKHVELMHFELKRLIVIPPQLTNNIFYSTTGLGGLFLNYRSDTSSNLRSLNSKVQFTLYFNTTTNSGVFLGENIGFELTQKRNISNLRGVNKPIHYTKVVDKLNKWFQENTNFLYENIENKVR
jgi:hypothetical protein